LKKSISSQKLIDATHFQQWQHSSQLQIASINAHVAQYHNNSILKPKMALGHQDLNNSHKIDLFQPLTTLLNKNTLGDRDKASEQVYNKTSPNVGKSRNVSEQCFKKEQMNSEYNTMKPQILFKTGGSLLGASRNSKQ